jgi:hypothetical protein
MYRKLAVEAYGIVSGSGFHSRLTVGSQMAVGLSASRTGRAVLLRKIVSYKGVV